MEELSYEEMEYIINDVDNMINKVKNLINEVECVLNLAKDKEQTLKALNDRGLTEKDIALFDAFISGGDI